MSACARDSRSCMDPENALGGPNPQNPANPYPGSIYLGPWIIAVDSPFAQVRPPRPPRRHSFSEQRNFPANESSYRLERTLRRVSSWKFIFGLKSLLNQLSHSVASPDAETRN
jgi:hypothetical protein